MGTQMNSIVVNETKEAKLNTKHKGTQATNKTGSNSTETEIRTQTETRLTSQGDTTG